MARLGRLREVQGRQFRAGEVMVEFGDVPWSKGDVAYGILQ